MIEPDDDAFLREALSRADPATARRSDPFFVASVMGVMPQRLRGASLSPGRRAAILAAFYGGAAALAGVVAVLVPESTAAWSSRAHALADGVSSATGGWALDGVWIVGVGVVAVAIGMLLALSPPSADTPAT